MNVLDVVRWMLKANAEELSTLKELLEAVLERAEPAPTAPVRREQFPQEQFPQAKLKKRKYRRKTPVAAPTVAPARLYAPETAFGRRWWKKLQAASKPMTPQQLARAVGQAALHKRVSTTLGTLYKRGVVDRERLAGSSAFLYTIKPAL